MFKVVALLWFALLLGLCLLRLGLPFVGANCIKLGESDVQHVIYISVLVIYYLVTRKFFVFSFCQFMFIVHSCFPLWL